ncbi:hypothetical protein GCM10025760_02790 [Microbacterium yannicii]|uniref:Uncharacterized protein n=1 Tax=Microbacterium yannicii TaxID=671622 RepID=A0ABP9LSQ4_9MICO
MPPHAERRWHLRRMRALPSPIRRAAARELEDRHPGSTDRVFPLSPAWEAHDRMCALRRNAQRGRRQFARNR